MQHYRWRGIDYLGRPCKGSEKAASIEALKKKLLSEGIALLTCKKSTVRKSLFSDRQLAELFGRLAILVESGIPITYALEILQGGLRSKKLKIVLREVMDGLEAGRSFSASLESNQSNFSQSIVQTIRAGELSGELSAVLASLASHLEKKVAFNYELKKAALAPVITLIFSIAIVIALVIFVLPQIAPFLVSLNGKLPWTTKMLLSISSMFATESNRLIAAFALGLFLLTLHACKKTEALKRMKEKVALRIPFIKKIVETSSLVNALESLSFMTKSGIPLPKAIRLASEACQNSLIKKKFLRLATEVEHGKQFLHAFQASKLACLPEEVVALIAVGEQTGKLGSMLEKSGKLLREKLSRQLHLVTTLFQPILLIFVGLIIAGIMLSLYLPIFSAGSLGVNPCNF